MDRVLAGDASLRRLRPGQAIEVATGAMVPLGAEAVLPVSRARMTWRRALPSTEDICAARDRRSLRAPSYCRRKRW